MTDTSNTIQPNQTEDVIQTKDLLYLCLSRWYWFVTSLVVALGIAGIYLLTTPPVYTRSASLVIKEDSKGQSLSSEIGASFSSLGLLQTNTNVNNELLSLQSPALMQHVVKRLQLNVDYLTDGQFYRPLLYGQDRPVSVSFLDLHDNETAKFTLKLLADGSIELYDFTRNEEKPAKENMIKGKPNDTIPTPVGKISVTVTPGYNGPFGFPVYISCTELHTITEACSENLTVTLSDKKATVIDLSYQDICVQRAEDILNTLISIYNETWVKDKNQIAVSTSLFINERLGVIEKELGHVDKDISSYKSEHLLPDVQAASNMYILQANETNSQLLTLNTQLAMARYIRNYLSNATGLNQLLPVNSGLENNHIESLISEYNTLLLRRNSLVANSSEQNPLAADLDRSLISLRGAVISSVDNLMTTLDTQIKILQQHEQQTSGRIAASPTQAMHLLSVERQQKVKEALYLFLLQKREENELSQAFTAYNTRVITPPTGQMTPTAPGKIKVLLFAFILGLIIPAGALFTLENMNTTVRGRKDLENMTIPFVGEIPLSYPKKRRLSPRKEKEKKGTIVVKERNRNVVNEAFRVIRTNLEFMTRKENKIKIIMTSSINPGSGKTFVTMNLATSLVIKGLKVLVIDLDLRKATLSTYVESPALGISDYLSGFANTLSDIIVQGMEHSNPDVIPVGTIPPNPTELLFAERLEQMLNDLRTRYDYIFLDCPPVEIVADAAIVNKLADMTLFIIRAGLLDRRLLPEIEKFYTEHKYKGMSMILNGTTETYGHYGYYKYGNRYGYSYT